MMSDGIILFLHANNNPLINLTVDGMARQVKLTPLSPNITYSVSIASLIRGQVSDFSSLVRLDIMNTHFHVKKIILVMSIIMVVLLTLVIIGLAIWIFYRIKNWDKARDIESQLNLHDAHQPTAYHNHHPRVVQSLGHDSHHYNGKISNHYAYSNIVCS
jgi:hypothetical protein